MMILNFGHIGNSLGTRIIGQRLRGQIEMNLRRGEFVSFDFSDVSSISHSFADECFGKLLLSFDMQFLKKNSTFINTNEVVKRTITFSLKERANDLVEA